MICSGVLLGKGFQIGGINAKRKKQTIRTGTHRAEAHTIHIGEIVYQRVKILYTVLIFECKASRIEFGGFLKILAVPHTGIQFLRERNGVACKVEFLPFSFQQGPVHRFKFRIRRETLVRSKFTGVFQFLHFTKDILANDFVQPLVQLIGYLYL